MPRLKPTDDDLQERTRFAEVVRKFRKANVFSQKKLCEAIGISRRCLQKVEAAEITPHPTTKRKIIGHMLRFKTAKDFNFND